MRVPSEYVPAAQVTQVVALAPAAIVPPGHALHVDRSVRSANEPGAQYRHAVDDDTLANWPAAHDEHADAAGGAYVPTAHAVHVNAIDTVPGSQSPQPEPLANERVPA